MQVLTRLLSVIWQTALLGLAALTAVAATASLLGRWAPRYDLLTHFALAYLAAAGLVLPAAFLARGRPRLAILSCGVVALAAAFALIGPSALRWNEHAVPATWCRLKIVEINSRDRSTYAGALAAWIVREDPDVVVAVEGSVALERELKLRSAYKTVAWDGILMGTREEPAHVQAGWPPIGLPGAPMAFTWIDLPLFAPQPSSIIAVHPSWPIPARHAWAEDQRIIGILDRVDRKSAILVGDFNSTQFSFRQRRAEKAFGLERRDVLIPTWPDVLPFFGGRWRFPVPFLPIDHIYAGSNWRTVKVERGPRLGSDHYPLVATLAWAGPLRTGDPRTSCPGR